MGRRHWTFTEDRQWAKSHMRKNWDTDHGSLTWTLEVRSEDSGAGSVRLGQLIMRGSASGEMLCQLDEET